MILPRSAPMIVSIDDSRTVFKLDNDWKPLEYIRNDYETNGQGTVADSTTSRLWQISGSAETLIYEDTLAFVQKMNHYAFGGKNDWRLPTIEELVSLLEKEKKNGGLHIDPVFDNTQRLCWSSDKCSAGGIWGVHFAFGEVYRYYEGLLSYVRLVRNGA
jgi:serine/threonine-protein kinase